MRMQAWIGAIAGAVLLVAAEGRAWNRSKAFEHLEARQRLWAEWKPAQKPGGPCISCHSGVSHMLARRAAGQVPAAGEVFVLAEAVRSRVRTDPPVQTLPDPGAEVVLNLLTLSLQRPPSAPPGEAERAALDQLWKAQRREGPERGSWTWVDADLEPMDATKSNYLGTAFAALAVAAYPEQPPDRIDELRAFLRREAADQPLHNRLAWAAFVSSIDRDDRKAVLDEVWKAQSSDGGWTTRSLGPWSVQEDAPPDAGSNAYATAWATYAALQAGTPCTDARMRRALAWLESRQDPVTGGWIAPSMNKVYRAGTIQEGFMSDAASGYAAAALVTCGGS